MDSVTFNINFLQTINHWPKRHHRLCIFPTFFPGKGIPGTSLCLWQSDKTEKRLRHWCAKSLFENFSPPAHLPVTFFLFLSFLLRYILCISFQAHFFTAKLPQRLGIEFNKSSDQRVAQFRLRAGRHSSVLVWWFDTLGLDNLNGEEW